MRRDAECGQLPNTSAAQDSLELHVAVIGGKARRYVERDHFMTLAERPGERYAGLRLPDLNAAMVFQVLHCLRNAIFLQVRGSRTRHQLYRGELARYQRTVRQCPTL